MSQSASSKTPRRADHVRNEARLLQAAREVFAEQGAEAPIEEIARRAGFAKGTFFRHFPTKESLVQALVVERLTRFAALAREINATHEPGWGTLRLMLESFLEEIADDRSLAEFLERGPVAANEAIVRARRGLDAEVDRAVSGAQARGEVRPDVSGRDFPPLMFMIVRTTARLHASQPALGRRYLRLFLDGMRAGQTSDLGEPPRTRTEVDAGRPTVTDGGSQSPD